MEGARSIAPIRPISRPGSRRYDSSRAKLQAMVAIKLMQDWLPERIPGWLKRQYPKGESLRLRVPPRNDLSQTVHSSAGSAETGAYSAPANPAANPPLAILQCPRTLSRADRRCPFHEIRRTLSVFPTSSASSILSFVGFSVSFSRHFNSVSIRMIALRVKSLPVARKQMNLVHLLLYLRGSRLGTEMSCGCAKPRSEALRIRKSLRLPEGFGPADCE